MSVQADEAPDDEPRKHGDSYDQATSAAVDAAQNADGVLTLKRYVARLMCGHVAAGETRATKVRLGSHGQWCDECDGFQLFEDFISSAPLTDSRGRA